MTLELRPGPDGLLPVVVQHAVTGQVLMQAYTTLELLERTLEERRVWFWSRKRGKPWLKGETSGNYLEVDSVLADCDGDALLVVAHPRGPTCHLGKESCFHRPLLGDSFSGVIDDLSRVIQARKEEKPPNSYSVKLLEEGEDSILRKVSEESCEVLLASKGSQGDLVWEVADLWFHTLLLLAYHGLGGKDVLAELQRRASKRSSEAKTQE